MHVLPQREIFRIAKEEGTEVLEVLEDSWTGRDKEVSNTFVLQRPAV